jgi:PAS domain S-box-containing protein
VHEETSRSKIATPTKEELFESIVESATGFAIFTMDPDGIVTSWNPGSQGLLGYAEKEFLGQSGDVLFTPEDRAQGAPEAERTTAREKGRAEDERWHVRQDGSRLWGSGLLMPLRGEFPGFVKVFRDMTDQHRAEDRLKQSEELFRVLATHIPQLVFKTLGNGHRTWGSPQWIEFTGFSLEESVGFGWLGAIHPEDRDATLASWAVAQSTGEYLVEHRTLKLQTGEYRWHQTRARPVSDIAGEWVGTSADIHDLRTLQDRQRILLAELQHRTRNLLSIVQALARQTLRKSVSLSDFETEYAERLSSVGRVQGLLAQTDHHSLQLRKLVESELFAHAGGSETERIVVEGPDLSIPGETAQTLALALHELATNAVKYGALARSSGRLKVTWRAAEGETPGVILDWLESGVAMPMAGSRRKGYGSELIERALPYQLNARTKLDFGSDGVQCQIEVPV